MPSISSTRKSTRNAAVAVLCSAALANAIVTPNLPYGGVVDRTGSDCQIGWAADTTGAWNSMDIELMTGDNFNFVHLAWVARGVDGTGATNSYTWTCPDVTINAPIYFYQFTQTGQDATYTTRFTIAAADGTTVPAPNQTQPGGQAIPWGVGAIVGGSPDSGNGSSSGTGSSSSGSGSSSGAGSSSASSPSGSSSSNTPTAGASASASSDDSSAASADTTVVTVQPSSSTTIRRMSTSQSTSATSGVTTGNSANRGNSTAGSSDTGAASAQVGGSSIAGIGMALALAIAGLAFA